MRSTAGLVGAGRMVAVGPPLSATGPSSGSVFVIDRALVRWQLESEEMLKPPSVSGPPPQFTEPWSFARIVAVLTVLSALGPMRIVSPTPSAGSFQASVELESDSVP